MNTKRQLTEFIFFWNHIQ